MKTDNKYMDSVMVDKTIKMANSSKNETRDTKKVNPSRKRVCKCQKEDDTLDNLKTMVWGINQFLLMILLLLLIRMFS